MFGGEGVLFLSWFFLFFSFFWSFVQGVMC